jgi:predicted RNA-binding protein with PIN domain
MKERLVIDGYSLLYRDDESLARHHAGRPAAARRLLVRKVERVAPQLARRVTVVFDGRDRGGPGEEFVGGVVEVLFSPASLTADSVIERLVSGDPDPGGILVVCSDRAERETVEAAGASSMSCGDFLEWLGRENARLRRPPSAAPPPRHTLGDHLL